MKYQPTHLKLWTLPPSYFGTSYTNTYSSGFGQSRNSDCLERSNFRIAWKLISKASKSARIIRESHFLVGWVEWIAIPARATKALKVADELNRRYQNYPILDENDHSELETEEANEVWANCYRVKDRIKYIRNHPSQFDSFHNLADMLACVRGKYFAGYASELIQ